MTETDFTPIYGPIPVRAFADQRLEGADFRVLGIISAHDRLGANGTGCYASHKTLCAKIGIHYVTFSKAVKRLGECGYLEAKPHPLNKRLRVYSVIYTDADRAIMKARPAENEGEHADETVSPQANNEGGTVSLGKEEAPDSVEESRVNIFSETGKISSGSYERDSAEAAPPSGDAINGFSNSPSSSGAPYDPERADFWKRVAIARRTIERGGYDQRDMLAELEALEDLDIELGLSIGDGLAGELQSLRDELCPF